MKRILITGIAGFIGSSLKNVIEKKFPHYEVYGLDIALDKTTERYFKRDINDTKSLRTIINEIKPHYIIHLTGGLTETGEFTELVSVNVVTTYSLLDSLFSLGNFKTRIVVPGSAAEYGQVSRRDMPIKEGQSLKPINFYGLSKMYQTSLALSYCRKGLDVIVGRIFNITGRATPYSFSIGKFAYEISMIEKGCKKAIIETKDLDSKRDFLDIQDVCSALIAVAERGKRGDVYNICSGESYKIKDTLNYLVRLSSVKGIKIKSSRYSGSEIKNIRGSNKKMKRCTEWVPKIPFSESLKETLDYYRNNY